MEKKNVFVVDNDPFEAKKIRLHLEALGFSVAYFASGAEMMAHLSEAPALIILAHDLGEENNGLDYLKMVKEIDRTIPVIFLVPQNNLNMAVHALRLGACFYFEKLTASFEAIKNVLYDLDIEKKRKYWTALRNFRQGVFSLYGFY